MTASLCLILDVDDTLLKEVSLHDNRDGGQLIQLLRYRPSDASAKRYKQRLEGGDGTPAEGRVIHYEFDPDGVTMISAVVLRPGICELLHHVKRTAPACELILASANDEPRTQAVCEQLRLHGDGESDCSGSTLAEFGFRVVPRTVAIPARGVKDVAAIRSWSSLGELSLAIVLDDKPEELINTSRADHIVVAPAFSRAAADALVGSNLKKKKTSAGSAAAAAWSPGLCLSAEREMAEQVKAALHDPPKVGVTLPFLRSIWESCVTGDGLVSLDLDTASTNDVCEAVVKSRLLSVGAERRDKSVADLVVEGGLVPNTHPAMVGSATHFVSHAWSYKFKDLIDALEFEIGDTFDAGAGGRMPCYFWLDIFVVPQMIRVTPPSAWWATTFFRAVAAEAHFVLVAYKWDAPTCVTRCWCLWELYAAISARRSVANGSLQIAMPREQREAFRRKLLEDVHFVQAASSDIFF